jgi:hypothetical protein
LPAEDLSNPSQEINGLAPNCQTATRVMERSALVVFAISRKRSRPAFADRAWIQWQVGLTTVPAAATTVRFCRPLLPSWRVESSGVTGPQKQIRRSHRRHLPLRRIPTARLPEHGLRGSLDYEPHVYRGHGMWRGSGWPPTKGIQVIRCCKVLPPMPMPSMNRGGGGRGRRNIA